MENYTRSILPTFDHVSVVDCSLEPTSLEMIDKPAISRPQKIVIDDDAKTVGLISLTRGPGDSTYWAEMLYSAGAMESFLGRVFGISDKLPAEGILR